MRTLLLIAFTLYAATACNNRTYYENAAKFEDVVQSWQLYEKSVSEAVSILANKGFICKEHDCHLHTHTLPCSQTQSIFLVVSDDGKVIKTTVLKDSDGELPSVCL